MLYTLGMGVELLVGLSAFVILGIMFALLHVSSRRAELDDPITEEIIIRAETGPIRTREEADNA